MFRDMVSRRAYATVAAALAAVVLTLPTDARSPDHEITRSPDSQLPLQPQRDAGQSITAAFEGWYQNPDSSYTLLVGYFNRNLKQTLDIPVGPSNRIEPGGPDYGQPTHFQIRRQWGVLAIKVPKDFGDKRLTWTIVANGHTTAIPFGIIKGYQIEPFKDAAQGNEPPTIQFDPKGPVFQGPPVTTAATFTGTVGQPVTLDASVSDDAPKDPDLSPIQLKQPPIVVVWNKYRGPGDVTIDPVRPPIKDGKVSTTATFSQPGEYVLRAQVNDRTGDGGGGFQCCWTNAHVKVTITGGTAK